MGVQLDAGGNGKDVRPNINVTPLVDVVLVLLIIFMLVIPNMQEGVAIELFKAKNAEKDSEEDKPIVVTVAVDKTTDGDAERATYHLDDVEFSRAGLIAELAKLHDADGNRQLLFRGDSRLEYGLIRDVFREAQNLGFAYIQLSVGAQKEGWAG